MQDRNYKFKVKEFGKYIRVQYREFEETGVLDDFYIHMDHQCGEWGIGGVKEAQIFSKELDAATVWITEHQKEES